MRHVLTGGWGERLRALPYSYPEVGATAGTLPPGYHHLRRERVVGRGTAAFRDAAAAVLDWRLQLKGGLRPVCFGPTAPGSVAILRFGPGPLAVWMPVRVVYVVDEPDRQGFAYGTLPGHLECGEESFVVSMDPDETVRLRIVAFSRPGRTATRLAGPLGRIGQSWMTRRYLHAV